MSNLNENYGRLEIKLSEMLEKSGMTKNKLSYKAEMSWNQINKYCNGDLSRLDILILCKLCTILDCKIEDLLEFIPAETEEE